MFETKSLAEDRRNQDLGITQEAQLVEITIDLSEVVAFLRDIYDDDDKECTSVYLRGGAIVSIDIKYEDFSSMIRNLGVNFHK